jgi:PAS domain S-box-containing protein
MTIRPTMPSDHFAAFAFSAADILCEVDSNGEIMFADGATHGLLGYSADELHHRLFKEIICANHHERLKNIFESLRHRARLDTVAITFISKDGEEVAFRLSGVHMPHKGERYYFSLRCEALIHTPEELESQELETGLLKKEAFAVRAGKHIAKANAQGEEVQVTIVDIPGLSDVLDTLTQEQAIQLMHSIGDYIKSKAVHKEAAGVIDRGSYSIITPGSTKKEEIINGIKGIAQTQIKGLNLRVEATNVSTTSEEYPLSEQDLANAVLYTINRFAETKGEAFSIKTLNESYEEMLDLTLEHISSFRKTLNGDEFSIAFQPIVNLRTGIVHHHECLVRLHENKKFSNPFEFITFGEQAGLINEFDLAITEKVLQLLRDYKAQSNPVMLAINLSGRSLSSNIFIDTFLSLLRDYADVRGQLMIEITESFKIDNMTMANDFIQTLRKEGNLVCLDDFGVGESSFNYLRYLQVDFVKIDGSYVRDSMQTDRGRRLLKAMASLCRNLDMMMIGEMVETQKEAEFLYESGVQYGQGYHIGKPSTDEAILNTHGKITNNYSGLFAVRRFKEEEEENEITRKAM